MKTTTKTASKKTMSAALVEELWQTVRVGESPTATSSELHAMEEAIRRLVDLGVDC